LQENGFVLSDEAGFRDMANMDERRGMPDECSWLKSSWRANGLRVANVVGSDPEGVIAVPKGWALKSKEMYGRGQERGDAWARMLFIRTDGEHNIFLNRRTGREVRVRAATRREFGPFS
jgi:hypothetical protein